VHLARDLADVLPATFEAGGRGGQRPALPGDRRPA
jgi:hypothetical protein